METKFHGNGIVEIVDDNVIIKGIDDVFGLLYIDGCSTVIVRKENIISGFFDLSTGIAGEILQKFSTYNIRLAIIGDYSNITSKSLRDFIYESNKIKRILFVDTIEEALGVFNGKP
jgi:hypothetical protein